MMNVREFITAAKLPRHLLPWDGSGGLNARLNDGDAFLFDAHSFAGLHKILEDDTGECGGYTIMDDSDREITRHMAAIFAARGRVAKTGLGFGCFVRACLEKEAVEHIDVIEVDKSIISHFGKEFIGNPRVTIHHADAFKFPLAGRYWDLVWHDIYCDGNDGLQLLHAKLLRRYQNYCAEQGAWALPRWVAKLWSARTGQRLVGSPKYRRTA